MRIERSNFVLEEISTKRTSAGSLFPALISKESPGTIPLAEVVTWAPSRSSRQSSGIMFVFDAITLEEDQSCHALNAACMRETASKTIARARFACVGGSPSGFQHMKTSMEPNRRIDPNPLKK